MGTGRIVRLLLVVNIVVSQKPGDVPCACVPYYLCDLNGYIITDGQGTLEQRFGIHKQTCDDPIATCCKIPSNYSPNPNEKPYTEPRPAPSHPQTEYPPFKPEQPPYQPPEYPGPRPQPPNQPEYPNPRPQPPHQPEYPEPRPQPPHQPEYPEPRPQPPHQPEYPEPRPQPPHQPEYPEPRPQPPHQPEYPEPRPQPPYQSEFPNENRPVRPLPPYKPSHNDHNVTIPIPPYQRPPYTEVNPATPPPNRKPQEPGSTENPFPVPGLDTIVPKHGCGVRRQRATMERILGDGEDGETFFGELPWMIALLRDDGNEAAYKFKCGGSLIHPHMVLTAAHCVKDIAKSTLIVRAGEWDSQSAYEPFPHQDRRVENIVPHPNFNPRNLWYDVAVLYTDAPFDIKLNVDVLCLPPKGFSFDGARCLVSGWGKDRYGVGAQDGKYRTVLRKTELPIVPRDQCQAQLRETRLGKFFLLHESFVCAGGEPDKDSCLGDGGGPLICPLPQDETRWAQVGIVSWGIECGVDTEPAAYTNIPLFIDWIVNQIRSFVPMKRPLE